MLIASNNVVEINKLKALLKDEFEMKDLGAAKKILAVKWILKYLRGTNSTCLVFWRSKDDVMFYERIKHINVKFHFVRDVIGKRTVTVKKIGTEDNPVDMLTKSLAIAKFKHYLDLVAVGNT
uniref:Retrovirus-related Pol polyprotein from transposon TNT 1-94 n=1 Tax=Ananas comosus var. bracteatus TaxID=296719 RepID=A0A6V7NF71_ANACO|nr:unnamed protein product [Ananas comosus var. bracteatus]